MPFNLFTGVKMNELLTAKNEALADIDYFIHEIEENGLSKKLVKELVKELVKGQPLVRSANSVEAVADYLAIFVNIFQKAFQ
jgi:hypothetical protein